MCTLEQFKKDYLTRNTVQLFIDCYLITVVECLLRYHQPLIMSVCIYIYTDLAWIPQAVYVPCC